MQKNLKTGAWNNLRFAIYLFTLVLFTLGACQLDEEQITNERVSLSFSNDSIVFDTIFSNVASITRRIRVRNPAPKAVIIEQIQLAGGSNSPFSIIVNGKTGTFFQDELLLGGDSLLLLAEARVEPNNQNSPILVEDEIIFITNGNQQTVKMVAWGQDVFFINKQIISRDTTWTSEKPILLLDSVLLDSSFTLTIEKGTKIYANPNSTLLVGGSLQINGTIEEPVVFTSSRLDLTNAFGQWQGLFFLRTSKENNFENVQIRNAVNGIYLGTPDADTIPDLVLKNVIIENMLGHGIIAFTSDIYAENLLINHCAGGNIALYAGGYYYFTHCTWANFSRSYIRQTPISIFSNHIDGDLINDFRIDLYNSIIYGDQEEEIFLNFIGGSRLVLSIANNLLKTSNQDLAINQNILNKNPFFINPADYNYKLDTLSPAHNVAAEVYSIPLDIGGNARQQQPDLGVWERQE
jgi:hypothetical protein